MMENHSLDNLLGDLKTREPFDGLTFDPATGTARQFNPDASGMPVHAFAFQNTSQARNVTQSWRATHEQIDGGKMDGFVRSVTSTEPMGYYTKQVLPFAYSLAETFTVADRWFCSMPGPTYPNRRFLLAGTAFGGTQTAPQTLYDRPPPHGTIFDQLSAHGVSWADYFTDVPMTTVIPSIILKHLDHHHPIERFFADCEAGTLPAVSFVDPGAGVLSSIASDLKSLPGLVTEALNLIGANISDATPGETEEDPQDMYYGEAWAYKVVQAILRSPAWPRTLLIYTYDEHGGYFDHVNPPPAVAPDDIPPNLQPGDPIGGFTIYGPRVPAIVISPYSRPGGVTTEVHDHTSILATIEAKWNLPALTLRDANALPVTDFLDFGTRAIRSRRRSLDPHSPAPRGPSAARVTRAPVEEHVRLRLARDMKLP